MLTQNVFDHIPAWLLFLGTALLLLAASEVGYRIGLWRRKKMSEGEKVPANTLMGSALGLLAFLLAFTFGMSSARLDARKQLAQDEASAILRAYHRAQFFQEPQRAETSRLLREYVELRVSMGPDLPLPALEDAILRSEAIQDSLWHEVSALSDSPNAILAGFLMSLSELTDLQTKRIRAVAWNRIPLAIVYALYGIAFLGLATMGYSSGLAESRTMVPATVLVLAFSAVIVLIVDMERPRQELFDVPQQPMTETARRIQLLESTHTHITQDPIKP